MLVNHLTDEQLQAYLEGKLEDNDSLIGIHLSKCAHCRTQLAAYQHIFTEFNAEPEPAFSPGFDDLVMAKILLADDKKYPIKEFLTRLIPPIFAIGPPTYYLVISGFGNNLVQIFKNYWINFALASDFGWKLIHLQQLNPTIVVFAGIILITFGLLDRVLFHLKYRRMSV